MIIKHDKKGMEYSKYSHEEYHQINFDEAVSSSQFKLFIEHEKNLVDDNKKKSRAMILGTAFEDYLYDKIGINKSFYKKYINIGNLSLPSNLEEILGNKDANEKESFYLKTLTGKISKSASNEAIDIIVDSGFKIPLKGDEIFMLEKMFDTFSCLEFEPFFLYIDALTKGNVEFEKIIVWEKDGIRKRCKPDILFISDDHILYDDIKTTSSTLQGFNNDINIYKYYIQAIHTREGIQEAFPGHKVFPCRYPVVSKAQPILAKIFSYSNNKSYEEWAKYDDENFQAYRKAEDYYSFKIEDFREFLSRYKKGFVKKFDDKIGYIKINKYGMV